MGRADKLDLHPSKVMHTLPAVRVRFDDHRPGRRRSFELLDPVASAQADRVEDVIPVIEQAERHAAAGRWVAMAIAYEAAPGLRPSLSTRSAGEATPLVWYAAFDAVDRAPDWGQSREFELGEWRRSLDRSDHQAAIEHIRSLIAAGETYQVNHTLRLDTEVSGDLATLYRRMVEAQAGGFGAFIETDDWAALSASPELFFRWDRDGRIVTRPMKGTRQRGRTRHEDAALRAELAASSKDQAENVMIVDLLRNDLGQVCDFGSVAVRKLFAVEQYQSVWQLTSEIEGQVRGDLGIVDVLRALFPSGSVTGAPKRRTMEIIASLEPAPRGLYCGAIGYLSPDPTEPRAQFSVAIRTMVVDRERSTATYGTGGGVTWDSTPDREWAEIQEKTRVLELAPEPLELFETMRYDPKGTVVRAPGHLDRLEWSASHFGIAFDRQAAEAVLAEVDSERPLRVRLTLASSGRMEVELSPAPDVDPGHVSLAIDGVPVDRLSPFLFHKTNRRGVYEAAVERHPDADEVVLVNAAGHVTETNRSNLAVLIDGTWWTPPITDGLLPGVLRGELVDAGELIEGSVTIGQLREAEAVDVVNSLRGRRSAALPSVRVVPTSH